MSTLVLDIETIGEEWSEFDATTKEVLTHWTEKLSKTPEERNAFIQDIKNGLGFSPLTGQIVAIGLYDIDREKGVVYYQGNGDRESFVEGGFIYKERTEVQMLEEFWEGAEQYDTFVTFNGRAFDAPFLFHRSAIHSLRPTKNLLEGRYPYQQRSCRHVDLLEELTFFGAMQKRPNLHLFCRAYGIESPKTEVSGDDIAGLYVARKFRDIAMYNARDVVATTELYQKWQEYLQFNSEENINYND